MPSPDAHGEFDDPADWPPGMRAEAQVADGVSRLKDECSQRAAQRYHSSGDAPAGASPGSDANAPAESLMDPRCASLSASMVSCCSRPTSGVLG